MKYAIEGFSQQYAMALKKKVLKNNKEVEIKIDCTDLVILRWFVDFYPNMKKIVVDGTEYAWLTHKKLMEDLPLIDINRSSFISRMQKLVEFKILKYRFVKEGGSFSLYSFGENYSNLITEKGTCSNIHGVDNQTDMGVDSQTYTKDNNIIDNNIKDNIIYIVDYLNKSAGTHYRTSNDKTERLINARFKEKYTVADFVTVIDKKCKEWLNTDMEQYLRPETLFGTKFENYLNQKPIQRKEATKNEFLHNNYTKEQIDNLITDLDNVEV